MTSIRLLNLFNLFKKKEKRSPSLPKKYVHTVKYISGFENYHRLTIKSAIIKFPKASIKHWYVQRKRIELTLNLSSRMGSKYKRLKPIKLSSSQESNFLKKIIL
jgi:hypothetical protein